MKIVYIAGPYRAKSEFEVLQNIRKAEKTAIEIWKAGHVALCPHKNSAFLGGICSDEAFLEGGLRLLQRCDELVMVQGWGYSEGACKERNYARSKGIPVFDCIDDWKRHHEVK